MRCMNLLFVKHTTLFNGPFHTTLEGIQLQANEIVSFSGVHCNAIFGIKCIELMGFLKHHYTVTA